MHELRTLGALDLRDASGVPVQPVLVQPKRLALIVYLCLSEPNAYHRRDTLLPLFWPEKDELAARHALGQAVYVLRRSLGMNAVETRGNDELRLPPGALRCDAAQFREAAAKHRWAEALELYRGDFLQNLHVRKAAGFERWMESERGKLRRIAASAGWSLAAEQIERAALAEAERSAIRALHLDPSDEESARRFIADLAQAGAPTAALRFFDLLTATLADSLEVQPSPATRNVGETVRNSVAAVRDGSSTGAIPARAAAAEAVDKHSVGVEQTQVPQRARAAPRLRLVRFGWTVSTWVLLLLALTAIWALSRSALFPRAQLSSTRIAVFPFGGQRSDQSVDLDLGEGMMDLLSDALDGAGEVRRVDPNAIMHRLAPGNSRLDIETAFHVAREFGAGYFVLGHVLDLHNRIRVWASLYSVVAAREPMVRSSHEGAVEDLPTLVDSLARDILTQLPAVAGEFSASLTEGGTRDYWALRYYLRGQAEMRRRQIDSACAAFSRAVREDSAFAMAWLRLAESEEWGCASANPGRTRRVIAAWEQGYRLRNRLSKRDQMFLATAYTYAHGQGAAAQTAALAMVDAYPDAVEGWRYLGDIRWGYAWQLAEAAAPGPEAAYRRALDLDPDDRLAMNGLALVAYHDGRKALGDSLWIRANGDNPVVPPEDSAGRSRYFTWLRTRRRQGLVNAVRVISILTDSLRDAREIAHVLNNSNRSERAPTLGHLLGAWVELARGRWQASDAEFRKADSLQPGTGVLEHAWFATFPIFGLDQASLRAIRQSLLVWTPPPTHGPAYFAGGDDQLPRWLLPHARRYLLGLLSAQLGDREAATTYAGQLDRSHPSADSIGLLHDFAIEVRAMAAAHTGDWDLALRILQREGLKVATEFDGFDSPFGRRPLGRFLRAEALYHLGRHDEALAWYGSFGWIWDEEVELGPAQLRIGQICEEQGDRVAALQHYRRFLLRWRAADPRFQPLLRNITARMARLGGPTQPATANRDHPK